MIPLLGVSFMSHSVPVLFLKLNTGKFCGGLFCTAGSWVLHQVAPWQMKMGWATREGAGRLTNAKEWLLRPQWAESPGL